MRRIWKKYSKFWLKRMKEKLVKHIQSPEFEKEVAEVLVSAMPKSLQDKVSEKQSLKIAVAGIDKMTDKVAESLGFPAD